MAIKPIKTKSISDEVLDQIQSQIISGVWTAGTKIPGEIELTKMFGVSRVSIREAIHRLVGMGVLTVKRGEGTFVTTMLPKDYFNSLLPILMIERDNLMEVLEFRSIIEVQTARLAALRRDEKDLQKMTEIIRRMELNKGNYIEFAKEDLSFHNAVSIAAHNSIIVKVNAIVHDILQTAMEEIIVEVGFEGGIYYHKKIIEAIEAKDEKAAMETMQMHIKKTIELIKKQAN